MPHMVTYRSQDGNPAYHEAGELDDAVRFVERLRNEEQVTEARIFEMREVAIKFKTYYQVEVDAPQAAKSAPPSAEAPKPQPAASEPAPAPAPAQPAPAPAPKVAATKGEAHGPQPAEAGAANGGGRFGLFGKQ